MQRYRHSIVWEDFYSVHPEEPHRLGKCCLEHSGQVEGQKMYHQNQIDSFWCRLSCLVHSGQREHRMYHRQQFDPFGQSLLCFMHLGQLEGQQIDPFGQSLSHFVHMGQLEERQMYHRYLMDPFGNHPIRWSTLHSG